MIMEDNQLINPPTGAFAGGNSNTFVSQPVSEPPDDFRTQHLLPKITDLLDQDGISASDKVFLRPNITRSQYRDLNQSLDIHLLREDVLDPMHQTIGKFGPLQHRITMSDRSVYTIPDVKSINCWPPTEDIGVNAVQRQALHAAATRNVTQKSIGRKIVIHLLENRQLWQGDNNNNEHLKTLMQPGEMKRFWESHGRRWNDTRCPIVIICMTNQALDQFLESLVDTTVRVIRIGSQSKSTLLEGFLMSNTKDNDYNHHKSSAETNIFFYSSKMKALGRVIEDLEDKIAFWTTQFSSHEVDNVVATRLELDRMEINYKHYITEFNFLKAKTEEALCRNVDVISMTTTEATSCRQLVNFLLHKICKF